MVKISKETKDTLIELSKENNIFIEGNIIKFIDAEDDDDFLEYLKEASKQDKENRKKRLLVTKQVQQQNKELKTQQQEKQDLLAELEEALKKAEVSKEIAEQDLTLLQKKTQTELVGNIVKVSLILICGIAIMITILYSLALVFNKDTDLLGNTFSNMLGILLTNSFSIIGTIMGVKYATKNTD